MNDYEGISECLSGEYVAKYLTKCGPKLQEDSK